MPAARTPTAVGRCVGAAGSLSAMFPSSIPADTSPEVFARQVERWRTMTIPERVELIEQLHADVEAMAIAGIRAATPGLSDLELRHELARRRYGSALADAAYASRSQ